MQVTINPKSAFNARFRPERHFKEQFAGISYNCGFANYIDIRFYWNGKYWFCCIWGIAGTASARSERKFDALNKALKLAGIEVKSDDRTTEFEITSDREIKELVVEVGEATIGGKKDNYLCHHAHG